MAKNIVLCSDGTGNSGGKGQGTNVWRIYHAIDRNCATQKQVCFYDDGVGTESNKYWRLFTGAFGFGFTRNVRDLYQFLALNYEDGDEIYLFGFSRGAYTVRALAAFVAACGVIKNALKLSREDLKEKTAALVASYNARTTDVSMIGTPGVDVFRPNIRCIGVWDTVSAVGLPFDIGLKDVLLHHFSPFRFRDLKLNPKVQNAFHAISIDDQRLTFHPEVWEKRDNIEQVWFAGVHSNVGGGYPKQGLAYVSLDWMMQRVAFNQTRQWGLHFEPTLRTQANHYANVHDKLYNSRAGAATYYRYTPRDVVADSTGKETSPTDPIKIHDSVFERIERKTLEYDPGNMPHDEIAVVRTSGSFDTTRMNHVNDATRRKKREEAKGMAERLISLRKALHLALVFISLFIAVAAGQQAIGPLYIPSGALFVLPALLLIGGILAFLEIPDPVCRVISLLSIAATALFWLPLLADTVPAFNGITHQTLFGGPIEVWTWVKEVFAFVLPDLMAELIIAFFGKAPLGAALVVAALVIIFWLKRATRKKLAAIHEDVADTVR